ncbi:MAG: copper homeostasis protein CutC [Propionibacteriaceae bacterium]|nr:copper homeostasis protein CutC [Propionibacteriaceae bacterium]
MMQAGVMAGFLQVRVKSAYEAECAEAGGADQVLVVGTDGLSPVPEVVEKVRAASTVHLRVVLRLREERVTDGGEMTRLKGLAFSYHSAGADGFVFGFLNALSGIDQLACAELAGDEEWPWTFDRAIDAALDQDRAWADVRHLPRVDSVMTAGSAREVEQGIDRLIAQPGVGVPVIVSGGLLPEHVPWLVRAGLTRFGVDSTPVTTDSVRAWRRLIDEETRRASTR